MCRLGGLSRTHWASHPIATFLGSGRLRLAVAHSQGARSPLEVLKWPGNPSPLAVGVVSYSRVSPRIRSGCSPDTVAILSKTGSARPR
ncbi:hypothetical protein N657DRAFT_639436 [Parathielavia appendiculata]|uniref:Uncharacterized protein n=1 Tax=Parathielavia appendiculata TaxID=2587402 RepID=A0AAN6Z8V7_9PEZI|nr:hypothetical protein N657DRAFT_639436 [Parathielavia appendiculata]